jgi:fructose-specific phosphotransferase system IIC component
MRRYIFGTGIIGAVTTGLAMLRDAREGEPFTWRTALIWLSWGIMVALAIGAIVDRRREVVADRIARAER